MPRIRTIKPEFPQSESMGRVSREARLTFVLLWTLADDAGRLRGNSRMLASLLYPYDEDAPKLIDGWMSELETEGCVSRYVVDGAHYVSITNWLDHQKIDKPSKSKIPAPLESSRSLANPLEPSSGDLRTKDQGPKDQEHGEVAPLREFDVRYEKVRERCEQILQSPSCVVWGRVNAWLKDGADPERDIYPTLEARKAKWGGVSLDYFDRAIRGAMDARSRPMPEASAPSKQQAEYRVSEKPVTPEERHAMLTKWAKKLIAGEPKPYFLGERDIAEMVALGLLEQDRVAAVH